MQPHAERASNRRKTLPVACPYQNVARWSGNSMEPSLARNASIVAKAGSTRTRLFN